MESYDPRKPIIKAATDDTPEVEGHRLPEPREVQVRNADQGMIHDVDPKRRRR